MHPNKLRVAIISIHYPPLRTSAANQMSDLAREFLNQGFEPLVITPNQDSALRTTLSTLDGVNVLNIASIRILVNNNLRRAIYEFLMPFMMISGLSKSIYRNIKWDLIVWYSPSIFFGPFIYYMKLRSKCKTYLILRDIFPEWAYDLRLISKGFTYYLLKIFSNFQYLIADTIGVQSQSDLYYLKKWIKYTEKKFEVLHNWQSSIINTKCSINIRNTELAGRKIFVYTGNMGVAQDLDFMMYLSLHLNERNDIGFIYVGRGSEVGRLKQYIKNNLITNTLFFDEINSSEIPGLLAQCYVGLVSLDLRHKSHNIPGKFLTYINAGIPILARINSNNDLIKLIEESGVGRVYDGVNIKEFANIIDEMIVDDVEYQNMSNSGPILAKEKFTTYHAVNQIIQSL